MGGVRFKFFIILQRKNGEEIRSNLQYNLVISVLNPFVETKSLVKINTS
ncbi:hypothetical protein TSIB_0336 [Thermococcus sibiricus MM 739]|uniref:Uncharacterized protein n=1 Tax=Thermococcus sibiricus (strain DSM 12597 / MM 739) TaxID=604354 RepID=C6A1A7_THESM|nr:hypothetical protein TSIB_0336 [Thermococcus sibiricus MM 739]